MVMGLTLPSNASVQIIATTPLSATHSSDHGVVVGSSISVLLAFVLLILTIALLLVIKIKRR